METMVKRLSIGGADGFIEGLCSNVVSSGGTTMVAGIGERMINELIALAPATKDLICVVEKKTYHQLTVLVI